MFIRPSVPVRLDYFSALYFDTFLSDVEKCGKTSLQCPTCGQRQEILVIRNAP